MATEQELRKALGYDDDGADTAAVDPALYAPAPIVLAAPAAPAAAPAQPAAPAPAPQPAPAVTQADVDRASGYEPPAPPKAEDKSGDGFLTRAWKNVRDTVTGDASVARPEIGDLQVPGLNMSTAGGLAVIAAAAAGADEASMRDIITAHNPDAKFYYDKDPNSVKEGDPPARLIVQVPGGPPMYVKRPGFTPQNVAAEGVKGLELLPGSGLVMKAPWLAGTALSAGYSGITNVANQLLTMALGGEQGVQGEQVVKAGEEGALGRAVIAPAIAAATTYGGRAVGWAGRQIAGLWNAVAGGTGSLIDEAAMVGAQPGDTATARQLTSTGRTVMIQAGLLKPDAAPDAPLPMTVEQLRNTQANARLVPGSSTFGNAPRPPAGPPSAPAPPPAVDPVPQTAADAHNATQVRVAAGKELSDEFGHDLTLGQATGSPSQLEREQSLLRTGAPATKEDLAAYFERQRLAAAGNKADLVTEASGNAANTNEEALGAGLNDAITRRAQTLSDNAETAWRPIQNLAPNSPLGRSVNFDANAAGDLAARTEVIRHNTLDVVPGEDADIYPQTTRALERVRGLIQKNAPLDPQTQNPIGVGSFNLGEAAQVRKALGLYYETAKPGSADARAVAQIKSELDAAIANARTTGSVSGNQQILDQWNTARDATRAYHAFVNPDDPSAKVFMNNALPDRFGGSGRYANGQATLDGVLGTGSIADNRGTIPIFSHLSGPNGLGPELQGATDSLSGAMTSRMLYGRGGTPGSPFGLGTETRMANQATINNVDRALYGPGRANADAVIPPELQDKLTRYRGLLDIEQASSRRTGPSMNPSGSADTLAMYDRLRVMPYLKHLPFGIGPMVGGLGERAPLSRAMAPTGPLGPLNIPNLPSLWRGAQVGSQLDQEDQRKVLSLPLKGGWQAGTGLLNLARGQ